MLEDVKINVKIKLSILWICLMFFYLYNDVLSFYRRDTIEGVMSGEFGAGAIQVTPDFLLMGAILMAIPIFMIFLSLALPAKTNRLVNIIVGIFHAVVLLGTLLVPGELWAYYAFYMILEAVFIALIVWTAWKWPTQEGMASAGTRAPG
ncbi:DUF6326 family protein [Halobacteriota archaeon]